MSRLPRYVLIAAIMVFVSAESCWAKEPSTFDDSSIEVSVAFEAPGRSVSGLTYDGHFLWITLDGEALILGVDPKTGQVRKRIAFSTPDTGGSAFDGRFLWQVAYLERTISRIDLETGQILEKIPAPGPGDSKSAGLTYDGQYLWVSNFDVGKIYRIDPTRHGVIVGEIEGGFETTGLAWDGASLWNGILRGVTANHGADTPVNGYVQQRDSTTGAMGRTFPINGVGPGTSDWLPGGPVSTKFWWYDGIHNTIVQVILRTESRTGPRRTSVP